MFACVKYAGRECDGCGACDPPATCPVCGQECDVIYKLVDDGTVVGCDVCIMVEGLL